MQWITRCKGRLGAGVVCLMFSALVSAAAPVLRVLAWPGYVDPEVVKVFERKTGAHVDLTVIDSDDMLWQRIKSNSGRDFDVFAVNTAELARYLDAGLVAALKAERIPNLSRQLPRFRDVAKVPGIVREGLLYAVPYTFADMGLIYDKATFPQPPTSLSVLWDPRYRGRVLAYDGGTHNFSLAALKSGASSPFRIGEKEWPALAGELIALRRNALGFYTQPDDSLRRYKAGKAVLLFANYGSQQLREFRSAGLDVGYVIPREGALAWLDCWAVIATTLQRTLAEQWINQMLEPAASEWLVSRQGLSSTVEAAPDDHQGHLHWLQPPENVDRRERLWKRIMSGDRLEKVLAP